MFMLRVMAGVLVLRVVLVVLLGSLAAGDWADGDDGVDRANGDRPGMPVVLQSSATPRDCASLCQTDPQCAAWAYRKPSCGGGSAEPLCYLKASVTPQSANPCTVSLRCGLVCSRSARALR